MRSKDTDIAAVKLPRNLGFLHRFQEKKGNL